MCLPLDSGLSNAGLIDERALLLSAITMYVKKNKFALGFSLFIPESQLKKNYHIGMIFKEE